MTVASPTRTALLALHRALLEGERRGYEKAHGRVGGGDFLQALIEDPAFAWLAPLTQLIARLDEVEDAASVLAAIRELFSLRPEGSEFQRRYAERIDTDPDLAVAHGIAMAELRRAMEAPHPVVGSFNEETVRPPCDGAGSTGGNSALSSLT